MNRHRTRVAAVAAVGLLLAASSAEADWREAHPVLNMSNISSENEADRLKRYAPVQAYFEEALGVEVRLHNATDYASTIEAMRAERVEFSRMGPAAYARATQVMPDGVEPVALHMDETGGGGYHSAIIVRADSPHRSLEDLEDVRFAFTDPNSASGYQMLSYFLRQAGVRPDAFFASTDFSGSHENSVMAVLNGTFDAAGTWYTNDERSNFRRMAQKGLIEPGQLRVVWKSPLIPSSPWVVRTDLPDDMREAIRAAILDMPEKGPEAWRSLTDGMSAGMMPVTHEMYEGVVEATLENLRERRGG